MVESMVVAAVVVWFIIWWISHYRAAVVYMGTHYSSHEDGDGDLPRVDPRHRGGETGSPGTWVVDPACGPDAQRHVSKPVTPGTLMALKKSS